MQIIEKFSEGLNRELDVVIPSNQLTESFNKRLEDIRSTAHIKGFRPGKVPFSHIKSIYGKSILSEIIDDLIKKTVPEVLSKRDERAAMRPKITINEGDEEEKTSRLMDGSIDLKLGLSYDILPKIEINLFDDLQITRDVCEIDDKEIDKHMSDIAEKNIAFEVKEKEAAIGDRITVDYTLSVDDVVLKDHSKENIQFIVGSEELFPETTNTLVDLKAGEHKEIERVFPEDHSIKDLAGKKVKLNFFIKEVSSPLPAIVNDDLAIRLGFESEAIMRDFFSNQIKKQSEVAVRQKLKRQVIDYLNEKYIFDIPQSLLDNEYNGILQQIRSEMNPSGNDMQNNDSIKEEDLQDYRVLAERRVRAGIVLGTIGEKNSIEVTEEEIKSALYQQLSRFPGHEKKMLDYFQNSPNAIAELRAPIFEEKVIDYILKNAQIVDKKVTVEQLFSYSVESSQDEVSNKIS